MTLKKIFVRVFALILAVLALAWGFYSPDLFGPNRLPGGDWYNIWEGIYGFRIDYAAPGLFNPPWSLVILWPIAFWPFKVSWSLLASITFLILMFSVPRSPNKRLWVISLFLLLLSYQALRQILDGNLEAIVIAGTLVLLWALRTQSAWGFAIASVLLSIKIQETWLLLGVTGVYLVFNWPKTKLAWAAAFTALFVLPFVLWKGSAWMQRVTQSSEIVKLIGGPHNVSLRALMIRLEIDTWAINLFVSLFLLATLLIFRKLRTAPNRFSAAGLIIAGQLAAPYCSNTSAITPLAIGIIPLLHKRPWVGLVLIMIYYLVYLLLLMIPEGLRFTWETPYWTTVLLITWAALFFIELKAVPDQSEI